MYSKQSQEPKRPKPNEEQNLLDLLQKKIKKETDLKSLSQESTGQPTYSPSQPTYTQTQPTYIQVQPTYGQAQPTYAQAQPTYNPGYTLNTLMPHQTVQVKTETPNSTSVYFPLLSQQQNIQQNIHMPAAEINTPTNFSNMSLAQMINLKNQNSNKETSMITVQKPVETVSSTQALENSMKDFQSKLLSLVLSQNQILSDLKEKNDLLQDTLGCLVTEVATIKKSIKPTTDVHSIQNAGKPSLMTQIIGSSADTINSENLLTYLYGSNHEFQYQLVLKQELSLPLYRERNFKFTVMLVDQEGKVVENSNRIPLTIGIYSSENPPKYIDTNTSGNKILKGFIERDLKNGTATFDKIQIKEVTSHFRNGWVFFVVYPKVGTNGGVVTADGNLNSISGQKIKPLVIEKVVVKAKKTKEKGANADAEDNMVEEADQDKDEVTGDSN